MNQPLLRLEPTPPADPFLSFLRAAIPAQLRAFYARVETDHAPSPESRVLAALVRAYADRKERAFAQA